MVCFESEENWGGVDVGERDRAVVRGCRGGLSCMLRWDRCYPTCETELQKKTDSLVVARLGCEVSIAML